jgi:hypothetical protein
VELKYRHRIPVELLPREAELAHILRFRGIRVDRFRMTIVVPFEDKFLEQYERDAMHELKSVFHFLVLPWEPSV